MCTQMNTSRHFHIMHVKDKYVTPLKCIKWLEISVVQQTVFCRTMQDTKHMLINIYTPLIAFF